MAIRTTRLVRCDHTRARDGKQCTMERQTENIDYTEPMYHIVITISVLDANGATCLVSEDVHLCYWDLYYHLSNYHEQAQIDVASRKAQQAGVPKLEGDGHDIDRLLGPA